MKGVSGCMGVYEETSFNRGCADGLTEAFSCEGGTLVREEFFHGLLMIMQTVSDKTAGDGTMATLTTLHDEVWKRQKREAQHILLVSETYINTGKET